MSDDKRWREILESEPPRLRPEAAARLDARIDEALRARTKQRARRWTLSLVPALLVLALILWMHPWRGEEQAPGFFLLDEESFLSGLAEYRDAGGELDGIFDADDEDYTDYETEHWTDEDWQSFQNALEGFQLSDNGGTQ